MALTTPIALSMSAFDATQEQDFRFTSSGGNQVVANRITIKDNVTSEVIYQNKVDSYGFVQTVPANTLENGKYYNFYFNTYDVEDNISEDSNVVAFYCFTKPTLNFTNLPYDNLIEQGLYNFELTYNQIEGELLNELKFYLYNVENELIKESEKIYSQDSPPIIFNYEFGGFVDDENYGIRAIATTLHGMVVDTGIINFRVAYDYADGFFLVEANNKLSDGYVGVESNVIIIDGETNNEPVFINGESILLENDDYVQWTKGFAFFNNKFVKTKWWKPVLFGRTNVMWGETEQDRIEVSFKRGIPNGDTEPKDCIEVIGYNNGEQYFLKRSNYIPILNNLSKIITYVNIDGENFDIRINSLNTVDKNSIIWNGASNVELGRITDIYWENEKENNTFENNEFYNPVEPKQFTNVRLTNSIVDHINFNKNTSKPYSEEIPVWDKGTILDCNFNNSIAGGNLKWFLNQIDGIKIKRRKSNDLTWMTIHKKDVTKVEDLSFLYRDYYIPSGTDFEWAIVPVLREEELKYFTATTKSDFDGLFISDTTKTMKLYNGLIYNSDVITQQIGMLQPYNKIYPKIISNPNVNYRTWTISGNVIGADMCNNFDINDRIESNQQSEELDAFLTNGKTKVITDWNGKILVGRITTPPSYTYNASFGNSVPNVTFTITEQGKYNNQDDMYNNGLINVKG